MKLNSQVKSAMIYPVAVIAIAAIVVAVILLKVIPDDTMRGLELRKAPSISESLDWARCLVALGRSELLGVARFDSAEHLRGHGEVHVEGDSMVVNGDRIRVFAERDPAKLPWGEVGADYVLECTGLFTSKAKASAHLKGGAKRVVISAPGGEDVDATIVYGVNHGVLKGSHTVISNASCTTNCLAPVAKVLHDKVGIHAGIMTTIHSYTNDQVLTDVYHSDLRRARSATMSQIPTKTGAAAAVGPGSGRKNRPHSGESCDFLATMQAVTRSTSASENGRSTTTSSTGSRWPSAPGFSTGSRTRSRRSPTALSPSPTSPRIVASASSSPGPAM